ncbi:O-antigen ligase family protein [Nitratireductor pacificus]|uniref:O-antigen polymerase n=1 Tax=Nitratireductor pacificus pht-3B TaxID=391937 RepID=K2MCF1_9HYPH|nr:O-antigen ligase family protein [Nitratireductor pacificus]EKF19841.1 O-antigen polymerase [Nitratireductor pacificus pht-3B]
MYRDVNRLFTFACFAAPPILGSVVSFVWHGGALWCAFEVLTGRRRLSPDRAMRFIALAMAVYAAANIMSFLANDPSWGRALQLLPLATFLLFSFSYSIWSISQKDTIARAAILGSAVAGSGALVLAVIQHYLIGMRAEGGAGNALVFAHVACLAGLVCLAAALTLESARSRWLLVIYAASFLAVLYSGSRSVWGVMIGVTVLLLLVCRQRAWDIFKGRLLAIVIGVAVIGVLTSGLILHRVELLSANWEALAETSNYRTSLGQRVALWEIATKLFLDRPILGYGMQSTESLIREHLILDYSLDSGFTHFHNGFLTAFVEGGIFSGGAVLVILAAMLVVATRILRGDADETARFGALLLLVVSLVHAGSGLVNLIFGHDIMDSVFMIFAITGLYLAAGTSMLPAEAGDRSPAAGDAAAQTRP